MKLQELIENPQTAQPAVQQPQTTAGDAALGAAQAYSQGVNKLGQATKAMANAPQLGAGMDGQSVADRIMTDISFDKLSTALTNFFGGTELTSADRAELGKLYQNLKKR
jgi:hypothetical protein